MYRDRAPDLAGMDRIVTLTLPTMLPIPDVASVPRRRTDSEVIEK
jgi:hypothetical protein